MGCFDFLYKALFRPLGCLFTFILLMILGGIVEMCDGITGFFTSGQEDTYREYILDKDYDKAHEYAVSKHLDVSKVLGEQVYDLMLSGNVVEAHTICAHEDQMYVYFHTLTSNVQTIYDVQGIDAICLAFSMIPYPSPSDYSLSDDFKRQWGLDPHKYHSHDDIVSENNRAIESLGNYLKAKNRLAGFKALLEYLQPTANTNGPDTSEVERIKRKFQKKEGSSRNFVES